MAGRGRETEEGRQSEVFKEPTNPEHFMRDCENVSQSKTNLPTKLAIVASLKLAISSADNEEATERRERVRKREGERQTDSAKV